MENEQTSSGAINTDLTFKDEKHDSASEYTESDWESGYGGYHADDDDKSLEGDEYIVATTSDGFVSTSLPHEIDKLSLSTPNAASSLPRTSTTTEAVLTHSARISSLDYVPSNSPFEVAPLVQSPSIPSALMPSAMPSSSVLSPSIPFTSTSDPTVPIMAATSSASSAAYPSCNPYQLSLQRKPATNQPISWGLSDFPLRKARLMDSNRASSARASLFPRSTGAWDLRPLLMSNAPLPCSDLSPSGHMRPSSPPQNQSRCAVSSTFESLPSLRTLAPAAAPIPAPGHKFSFNFWDEDSDTEPAGFHLSAPAHQSESTVPSSSVAQPLPQTPASSFKSLSADNQDIEFKDGGFLLSALALKHDFSSDICDEDNQDMDFEDRDFYHSAPLHPSELASTPAAQDEFWSNIWDMETDMDTENLFRSTPAQHALFSTTKDIDFEDGEVLRPALAQLSSSSVASARSSSTPIPSALLLITDRVQRDGRYRYHRCPFLCRTSICPSRTTS